MVSCCSVERGILHCLTVLTSRIMYARQTYPMNLCYMYVFIRGNWLPGQPPLLHVLPTPIQEDVAIANAYDKITAVGQP